MNFNQFSLFVLNDFIFSITIVFISFVFGWLAYTNFIIKKISLKDSLFEKDNLAAWVEFIGAFIFPTLYLASKALEGSASDDTLTDLMVCTCYAIIYIAIFVVLRMLSGLIVKLIAPNDIDGKINLNNEIYNQKNIAASIFSVILSMIFVNLIKFLTLEKAYLYESSLKISIVLISTLICVTVYTLILRHKTTLLKVIFVDNNQAACTCLLGFIYAVLVIVNRTIAISEEFDLINVGIISLSSLLILGILSGIFKWFFSKLIKVNFFSEIYEQNNLGAALGQSALYIGIANVIANFMI